MLVCEYPAVDELLHLFYVDDNSSKGVYGSVFPVSDDAQKHVVGSYSVASCPHRFLS